MEVEQWILRRYQGYRIVDTTQTYTADIVDWIDPASVPGSMITPPPRPSALSLRRPSGESPDVVELEAHPELRGPAGTIPFVRPRFDRYVSGESGAKSLSEFIRTEQQPGQPSGQTRLYGGYGITVGHRTAVTNMNNFANGAVENGTFSLLEMATICRGIDPPNTMEIVGAVLSRDRANFGNETLRIQVEFFTAGPNNLGDNKGGWDGLVTGFVAAAGRPYGPGASISSVSVVGGSQYSSRFEIQLFNGNWWVAHESNWMGYYPGTLFNLINNSSCEIDWYGEVFDPSPTDWTNNNMGSGQFANTGFGQAAYFRNFFYFNTSGVATWPNFMSMFTSNPQDSNCYTTGALQANGGDAWQTYFFLGGPGGDNVGCN